MGLFYKYVFGIVGIFSCFGSQTILENLEEKNNVSYQEFTVDEVGKLLIDDTSDHIKWYLTHGNKSFEAKIRKVFKQRLRKGDIVVDAGAHIGLHTLVMANAVGEKGRVYAFEPQKKIYNELCANICLNGYSNVKTYNCALSDECRELRMEVSPYKNEGGTRVMEDGTGEIIQGVTLDSLHLEGISLIKMDVENHEYHVLKGASATINRCRPLIIVEIWGRRAAASRSAVYNFDRVIELLRSWNYSLERLTNMDYLATPCEFVKTSS